MARTPRHHQIEKSVIFHVVNRGILKQTIFHDHGDLSTFVACVSRYVARAGACVYHWCLIPNHYHMVIELPWPAGLSRMVGGWQHVYAVRYHRKYQTAGRLFQGRFKSQAIEKERYLLACGRYVEQNPVRAGLCAHAWDWPWSSAGFYAQGKRDALTVLDPLWEGRGEGSYRQWLMDTSPEEERLFRSAKDVIGGHGLRRELLRKSGRLVPRGQGRKPG